MKNLFSILPEEFFKPLTSKYKNEYADCIELMFRSFKPELSYGVDRDIVLSALETYFDENFDTDMIFEDEEVVLKDSRAKANNVIRTLKECKWIEYEQVENYRINIVLFDYAATIIEGFNKLIKEDEMEYQSVISQIHASLQNKELYKKPYEFILKKVSEETENLISGLKKLSISIKKHMDQQTNEMTTVEILEHFFKYHQNIGSKSYLRMKTSDNVSYFRNAIIEKLDAFIEDKEILEATIVGYMEIEQITDKNQADDDVIHIIMNIKSSFYRLDDVIDEIDRKNAKYQQNAVMRAKFLLSTGNNLEGKLSQILGYLADEFNKEDNLNLYDVVDERLLQVFQIFPQFFIDKESLSTIAVSKQIGIVDDIEGEFEISEAEREENLKKWNLANQNRFSRKNIDEYVNQLLQKQERVLVSTLPLGSKRDLIRILFIDLYARNDSNCYKVVENGQQIRVNGYSFPDFEIVRRGRTI